MLKPYGNRSGKSGVVAYGLKPGAVLVKFRSGEVYTYSKANAGEKAVAAMSALAVAGKGLSTFISRHQPRHDPQ